MLNTLRQNAFAPVHVRPVVTLFAALGLSLALTACGGESSETTGDSAPPSSSTDNGDGAPGAEADGAALPEQLSDFPLPAEYSVRTAGAQGDAATAILYNIPGSWTELKAFYEDELPKAGWQMRGDRPFVGKEGTELDASKGDMSATVSITSVNNETGLVINLVGP